ncbi:DUF4097 family beta strand repeat-containing protein [Cellulomonas edaphi]|uniref:DUF4097 family beta strand repeat-containing protein n=1 Tax=Cellulomonas edaphi TaxID=3053468 RepID=A0ABT7S2F0_9CELL|nr:DUF4097 family beta strand repeat-containing protein [Cellulomons edaphi]MDM7829787.1 DUF4097 family beta strand repeat-containing protein [Cellulomons edaphi]
MTTILERPTQPPAPPVRRRGRGLVWAGGIVGGLMLLSGAWSLLSLAIYADADRSITTTSHSYAAVPVVELAADGDVRVTTGGTQVAVEAIARTALTSARYTVDEGADRLTVSHRCTTWTGSCSASLRVVVPEGTQVVVRASDGDVRASGLTGGLDVRAGDGRVDVDDVQGSVAVVASDGNVSVRGVTGDVDLDVGDGSTDVETVAGSVVVDSHDGRVTVAGVERDVDIDSSDGDVDVYGTGAPVALEVHVSDGRQVVDAPTDPAADRHVRVRAADGDVTYRGPRA